MLYLHKVIPYHLLYLSLEHFQLPYSAFPPSRFRNPFFSLHMCRVRYGADGALFPALPRSMAGDGVSFSAFPAPATTQAPALPIPGTGPR